MTKRKQGGKGDMKCFFKFLYIYFLAALALHCCAQAFSSCSERGLLSSCCVLASHCSGFSGFGAPALGTWSSTVVALGLSNMGSAVVVHGLSCPTAGGSPGPRIKPMSFALACGFSTTGPPGKSRRFFLSDCSM